MNATVRFLKGDFEVAQDDDLRTALAVAFRDKVVEVISMGTTL
jgi:hypothetical protein